jgi:hypothetical protein
MPLVSPFEYLPPSSETKERLENIPSKFASQCAFLHVETSPLAAMDAFNMEVIWERRV